MTEIISSKRSELAELCRKFRVRRLALFGSSLTPDFDPEKSDLDFLVEFQPLPKGEYARTYFDFSDALEQLFGRPIDLIEQGTIRNPYIQQEIERTRQTIYGA
jgi:predicted nucleotidyltransferase